MKFEAILFDMDGVIVDTEHLHSKAELATCAANNLAVPLSEWNNFRGKTTRTIFEYIVSHYSASPLDIDSLINHKTENYLRLASKEAVLIPGSLDFLKWMRPRITKAALATSSKKIIQELMFEMFDLNRYFDGIITGDDVKTGKPDPEPYLKAAAIIGVSPSRCIVIEDSDSGIAAAKSAGAYPIGITTSYDSERLMRAGAKKTAGTFAEISGFLESRSLL
jgi:HAD superfamily hydrolase (TIGR01509 family)